jgi:hypothetical protein
MQAGARRVAQERATLSIFGHALLRAAGRRQAAVITPAGYQKSAVSPTKT